MIAAVLPSGVTEGTNRMTDTAVDKLTDKAVAAIEMTESVAGMRKTADMTETAE